MKTKKNPYAKVTYLIFDSPHFKSIELTPEEIKAIKMLVEEQAEHIDRIFWKKY